MGVYKHTGVYRCMGRCTEVRGDTDVWGCTDVEVIQTPQNIQTATHTPHMPANFTWVLFFL